MRQPGCPHAMDLYRNTYAFVDLDAIANNVRLMKQSLSLGTELVAVVKANAYGHGSVPVSRAALEAGANWLAVAMAEEAIPLRADGIDCPILVIGPSNRRQLALGAQLGLDLCVFEPSAVSILEEVCAGVCKARVHLKVDTGMGRIGIRGEEGIADFRNALQDAPSVELVGMFTHLANADTYSNTEHPKEQYRRFMQAAEQVRSFGYDPKLHISNSAGSQNLPDFDLDMVRFGISLYGYPAGEGTPERAVALKKAMRVLAEISYIKDVPQGTPLGYGSTYVTTRPSRIATVQIGYGDGYPRLLSSRGRMLLETKNGPAAAPIVGRVCMDMTLIDVTGLEGVKAGDLAVVLGDLGDLHCDADNIAQLCGTISYEVLCDFTQRVPRIYNAGGGAPKDQVHA